jgi:prepilin-type N-terminal cleavage/methylation domain-containing protein
MKMPRTESRAFTLIEVLIVVAVLLMLALIFVPSYIPARARAHRIRCTSHLKQLGLAYKTWAIDHRDRFPMEVPLAEGGAMEAVSTGRLAFVYQIMSNELSTPFVLTCPSDSERRPSDTFTGLQPKNLSYFIGLEASSANLQCLLAGDRNITNSTGLRNGILFASTNDSAGWTASTHVGNGNILLSDGSVQQVSMPRLREAIDNTGFQTNRLLMP